MRLYPNVPPLLPNDLQRFLQEIVKLRQEDVTNDRKLDGRFLKGRLRTDRAEPTSVTIDDPDLIYDVVYGVDSIYIAINTGSAIEWRSIPLSRQFLNVGGTLVVNTTEVGNVTTGEDDLITYSLPAGSLATNGDNIELTAWGIFAANANNKTIKFKFGGTTILDTTAVAANGGSWVIRAMVIRTGAATQQCNATLVTDNTTLTDIANYTTATETLSSAVTFKLTGEATNTGDIIQKGLKIFKSEV